FQKHSLRFSLLLQREFYTSQFAWWFVDQPDCAVVHLVLCQDVSNGSADEGVHEVSLRKGGGLWNVALIVRTTRPVEAYAAARNRCLHRSRHFILKRSTGFAESIVPEFLDVFGFA